MRVGTFVSGIFRALPSEEYMSLRAESVPHQVYEVRVETEPMTADMEVQVVRGLMNVYVEGMQVLGVEAKGSTVKIQVTGSPFLWESLIVILPSLIGPIFLLIIGVIIAYRIPEWAWAALPIGLGGAVLLYAYLKRK